MQDITLDVWLYGGLASYGGDGAKRSYANLHVALPEGSTLIDLLAAIGMDTKERGITFINGQLSAMPGLQPDLTRVLCDGDRIGLFDQKSMWPFQYRHGVAVTEEMARSMGEKKDQALRHTYREK